MATLTITIPAGSSNGGAGEVLRSLSKAIQQVAAGVPDRTPTGASTVLTIDNGPATGLASVAITAGPYQSSTVIV